MATSNFNDLQKVPVKLACCWCRGKFDLTPETGHYIFLENEEDIERYRNKRYYKVFLYAGRSKGIAYRKIKDCRCGGELTLVFDFTSAADYANSEKREKF